MAINYIPNDPNALGDLPLRTVNPRADRPNNEAHYDVQGAVPQDLYDIGTPEFLYWQCREAALAAAEARDGIFGPLTTWQDGKSLPVIPDAGEQLNAFYDRERGGLPEQVSFFHEQVGTKTYFSGASTDVVSHELGHAFLDSIRPDFWDSSRFEVNSFHEAFGDCMALVTALNDRDSRVKILATVTGTNAVESSSENLAEGIHRNDPAHNAGKPRRARNTFQWGPQGSLPFDGGPGKLIYEVHSFGQVFSGCFYDTIVNIFNGMNSQSEANLLVAMQTAGKLLVQAIQQTPQRQQFFREVGRLMILVDEQQNGAANRDAIRDAFQGHNIALGSSMMLAPQFAFASAPASTGRRAALGRAAVSASAIRGAAKKGLLERIGAESPQLAVTPVTIVGQSFQQAVHERIVKLDRIHKKLKGVVAAAPQVALVGQSHNALSVIGHVSNAQDTVDDVEAYVTSLVKHGRIAFESIRKGARRGGQGAVAAGTERVPRHVTHEVRTIRGQKTLVRIRFACP